ncbi:hypothetical protein SSP24_84050 [Streptomyces spinoverrucosus]|uniref:Uncharacterized protein n=1 Tax=Streptomyces spinoverrucosus TaxID=284043 RepID=A0A4Y3VYL6_9ACTN|nr:hypothetical protein SSP24_84050 [Streptomyces spinoverrucosus]GHC00070.1 hypothetical protein GCM10010397_85100 [Streptomyces spinoverrucosus]
MAWASSIRRNDECDSQDHQADPADQEEGGRVAWGQDDPERKHQQGGRHDRTDHGVHVAEGGRGEYRSAPHHRHQPRGSPDRTEGCLNGCLTSCLRMDIAKVILKTSRLLKYRDHPSFDYTCEPQCATLSNMPNTAISTTGSS